MKFSRTLLLQQKNPQLETHEVTTEKPCLTSQDTIRLLRMNILVLINPGRATDEPGDGPIDIWWRGRQNGSLMLILAHLLRLRQLVEVVGERGAARHPHDRPAALVLVHGVATRVDQDRVGSDDGLAGLLAELTAVLDGRLR